MNNQLTSLATSSLSMSTREIAELTGKEHKHVMRDFRDMCEALEIVESNFGRNYIASNGKGNPEYLLPKDLTTTLVSGYSIPMRHAIVMRWLELEAKEPQAAPISYREAMMLAVERYEKLEEANKVIAIAAPKAKVYDEVVADKVITLRSISRMFHGVNTMKTQADLTRMGYLYKNSAGINVYAKYKDTYFSERVIEQGGFRQITVCAKGKELLSELYAAGRLTMKVGHQAAC
jgi:phage regulator Rha-like protein|tara:strand:- start:207 stop:905 length:699 start_codon:yes stop_codon:yes gene_type:complete